MSGTNSLNIKTAGRIRGALLMAGHTLESFAQEYGVTRQAVSKVLHGSPSKNIRKAISNTVEIPVDELFPPDEKL